MSIAAIGIGTNMGDRAGNIRAAVKALSLLPNTKISDTSHIYETTPVGFSHQPNFLNAAVTVETELSPSVLLGACLGIEAEMGRVRDIEIKNGPRVIDLDLLLYEHAKSESFELTLPHPRILERAFVMQPLSDIFPSGRALGLYFAPHLRDSDKSGVTKIDIEI